MTFLEAFSFFAAGYALLTNTRPAHRHTSVHTAPWRGHIPKEGHSQDPQKYFGDITHHLGDGGSLGQRLQTQRMSDFQKDVSKRLSSQPGVPSYVMGFTDVSSFGGAAVSSPSKR